MSDSEQWFSSTGQILGRSVLIGGAVGAVTGGVIGTFLFPIVATMIGAIVGAGVGVPLGLLNGLALSAAHRVSPSALGASGAAALTTGGVALALLPAIHNVWLAALACLTVLLAAAFAPLASTGAEPLDFGPGHSTHPLGRVVGRSVTIGAAIGGSVGMIAGGIIGGLGYLPTAPVAVVEGGVMGTGTGIVLALIVAGVIIMSRVELRH